MGKLWSCEELWTAQFLDLYIMDSRIYMPWREGNPTISPQDNPGYVFYLWVEMDKMVLPGLLVYWKLKRKTLFSVFFLLLLTRIPQTSWKEIRKGKGPAKEKKTHFPPLCITLLRKAKSTAILPLVNFSPAYPASFGFQIHTFHQFLGSQESSMGSAAV